MIRRNRFARVLLAALALAAATAAAIAAWPAIRIGAANATATPLPRERPADPAAVREAYAYLPAHTRFDAFVALHRGRELARWGEADLPINTHSVRKSLLSALYGIAIARGYVRPEQTLAELGIDDRVVPLTPMEKTATVRDLLMSRSGIYIEAAGEAQGMKDGRPRRGSHRPGEFFYYNNWDFNALGTIFERRTGLSIGEALEQWIARPLGMTAFKAAHVIYDQPSYSEHRQFVIFMSAADLARFGMLYADQGRWNGRQIVPADWVRDSTRAWSPVPDRDPFDAYGYLWWLDRDADTVWADGWGGQFMIVDARRHLVLVSRNDTGRSLLQLGWFALFDGDGWRSHHQHLHALMIRAAGEAASPAAEPSR
ncbi:serine hydrolase [Lysobacter sp. K5869]|uniref:serine hydrolase domain-containing protein n=1 Tax=Lysobacter sp. K5869 TaxID=2820808 RepID=UPI001C062DE6|nr:serine hydrolase [Lysobacter sp. K5869]QWP74932.1 serine hydrolase [Lysobacter sp. K5869]